MKSVLRWKYLCECRGAGGGELLTLGQSKRSLQILSQSCPLLVLLDSGENLSVDGDLVLLPLLGGFVFLLLGVKDLTVLLGSLLGLDSGEIFVVDIVGNLHSGDVDLGGCGQQEPLVDPSQRSSIQLERSSHQEQTGLQLLQDHNALALVDSGQDDGHGPSSQRISHSPLMLGEEVNGGTLGSGIHGGIVIGQLLDANHSGASILGSS